MAYAAAVTVSSKRIAGRKAWTVSVAETEAATASEYAVQLPGAKGRVTITRFTCDITAGTATTVQPSIGRATGWAITDANHVAKQSAAAAVVNDPTLLSFELGAASSFYVESIPDAGADNSITTRIELVEGVI